MSKRISIAEARDQLTELVAAAEQFRQTHDLADLDIEEVYAGIRDPSPGRSLDE